MSAILEALPPKSTSTTSNYRNEWLDFLDESLSIVQSRHMQFPELSMHNVKGQNGDWALFESNTSVSGKFIEHLEYLESDVVDDMDSPIMPAKNQFTVDLIIERIEKGRPSVCDEVEYEW